MGPNSPSVRPHSAGLAAKWRWWWAGFFPAGYTFWSESGNDADKRGLIKRPFLFSVSFIG